MSLRVFWDMNTKGRMGWVELKNLNFSWPLVTLLAISWLALSFKMTLAAVLTPHTHKGLKSFPHTPPH